MSEFVVDGIPVVRFNSTLRNYFYANSGSTIATGGGNLSLGHSALNSLQAGGSNIAIGDFAMNSIKNTFGNIAIGTNALRSAVDPCDVTVVGDNAGAAMTGGVGATLVGKFAFQNVQLAGNNTGVGDSAGRFTVTGALNTAMGYRTFEGNISGSYNVALGAAAMVDRKAGNYNTAVGFNALGGASTTLGSGNTAIGTYTGLRIEGSNNIVIGMNAGSGINQITTVSNSIAIGNDTFTSTNNQIVLGNSATQSTVLGGVSFTKEQLLSLLEIIQQSSNALQLTGSPFIDALGGDVNANTLDGGAGADLLFGKAGDDIYFVDNLDDKPIETIGNGTDTVNAAEGLNYVMQSGQEIELLQTQNASSTASVSLTGNEFDNNIIGNAGHNTLDGRGGADTLEGKSGNDSYVVDSVDDVIIEVAGGGTDTVLVDGEINYVLGLTAQVEVLKVKDPTSTLNIGLTGNNFGNTIVGNAGSNIILGLKGTDLIDGLGGDDTLSGDDGDDWFYAGTGTDSFDGGTGNNAIYYMLSNLGGVNINLTTGSGAGGEAEGDTYVNINRAYGTNAEDILTGAGTNDYLGGFGGVDQLLGEDGNDTLDGGALGDILDGGNGQDTAYYLRSTTGVQVNLATGLGVGGEADGDQLSNIEGVTGSNHGDTLTGNSENNILTGLGGDDTLDGGAGNDTLIGGAGGDTFYFGATLDPLNVDTITDFNATEDRIALDVTSFIGMSAGPLTAAEFNLGAVAQDADDRLLYDQTTGVLNFDSDGDGAAGPQQIATLQTGLDLTFEDFMLV